MKFYSLGKLSLVLISLFFINCCLCTAPIHAKDISVIGIDFAPMSIIVFDKLEGLGVEIIDEMAGQLKLNVKEKTTATIKRVVSSKDEPNTLISMLTKTKEREADFHWIGKLTDDTNCFLIKKSNSLINNLDEAKKLKLIGVNSGGATEKFLIENKFTNIDGAQKNSANIMKLKAGHIDAWYTSEVVSNYALKLANTGSSDYVCTGKTKQVSYYIAATLKTDPEIVEQMTKKFKEMEDKGRIKELWKKYLE